MDLSKNAIRERCARFVKRWEGVTSEAAEKQTFWNELLAVFGIDRRQVAAFEELARRASTSGVGWIDLLYPGQMAVEHKSAGKSLAAAMGQLVDYLPSLHKSEFPWLLIACDFRTFLWKNLDTDEAGEFKLDQLPHHLDLFWWMAGHGAPQWQYEDEEGANLAATALLAKLHDGLHASGYDTHSLREWLTRILFCLFADDTDVWDRAAFHTYIARRTSIDGGDLGPKLAYLFQVLNTAPDSRPPNLDEDLADFTYIDGDLFATTLPMPTCDEEIRTALLDACRFDWSIISPAIFGSMFQNVMTPAERRQLGAHYTTEENILKTIRPLFLDELEAELASANSRPKLEKFHDKLASLTFLDPACGCGNFLVIAYREIRRLETEALLRLARRRGATLQQRMDLELLCKVRVDQFYGIEIEEFPARIARTALYLIDHVANRQASSHFGQQFVRFPIPASPHILIGNALRTDWNSLLPSQRASYVFGNPPFVGKKARTDEQQHDMNLVYGNLRGASSLDYVACWYEVASRYVRKTNVRVAFVSTNSITQGEQVALLWPSVLSSGSICFAHRTFAWTSEARGRAHVHVVIIGFCEAGWQGPKRLFDYATPSSEPVEKVVKQINPYLVDAPTVFIEERRVPLAPVPAATFGSMPNEGGNLLLTDEEAAALRASDPVASAFLREIVSARELLHGQRRWCLWLKDSTAAERRASPEIRKRVDAVRTYREASRRATTQGLARSPYLFGEIRQPTDRYLCVPRHSSENRDLIPMVFFESKVIASDSTIAIVGADLYLFGVLQSAMFTSWVRSVGGRIKSDLRFSAEVVYNTFPFPQPRADQRQRVAKCAKEVLDARAAEPGSTLADLYDRDSTPHRLLTAHHALDRAVDVLFIDPRRRFRTDADRLPILLDRYRQITSPLVSASESR